MTQREEGHVNRFVRHVQNAARSAPAGSPLPEVRCRKIKETLKKRPLFYPETRFQVHISESKKKNEGFKSWYF